MTSKAKTAGSKVAAKPSAAAMASTPAVQQSAIVIDTHADTPQRFLDEHFDLGDPLKGGEFNLESARKGGPGRGVLLHLGRAGRSTRATMRGGRWS